MGNYFLKTFFAILMFLLHTQVSVGLKWPTKSQFVKCDEREKQSLLNFKQGLYDPNGTLSTWRDDESNRDCCKWEGIECDNNTGHVKMLNLCGDSFIRHLAGVIDIAQLIELQNIEYLDLSGNAFFGSQIPKQVGSFANLRYLNLSNSGFDGSIPCELGNLSKLEYLSFEQNDLDGAIPFQLGKLTGLQHLDLSDNYDIDGTIPWQLGNLSQLQYLDLGGTSISGAIPFNIGKSLPMLHTLKLDGNFNLNDTQAEWLSTLSFLTNLHLSSLPNLGSSYHWLQTIGKLVPNLRELRLVDCGLVDNDIASLFHSHSNISTSLTILDLSRNMLTSSTFQFLFNHSLNLEELYLSENNIVLPSPLYPNFPSLVILDLSFNNLTSLIFQGNFNFSKLREIHLRNCSLIDRSFHLSSTSIMNSSSSLVILDLSSNLLKSSTIFPWLFNFTPYLHGLNLYHNMIEGPIPDEFGKVMNSLEVLVLSCNKLQGKIPGSFGNICTLQELYLDHNNLNGEISSFIQNSSNCNIYKFQILDLSYNSFTGMLPNLSTLSSLRILDLSNNKLTGEIPKSIGLLYELESLHLEENYLDGDISESHFTNLFKLLDLDLTDNPLLSLKFVTSWIPPFQLFNLGLASCKLGPSFPIWLQTQNHLSFLDISNVGINDSVPDWFWSKLQSVSEMNMSHNNLMGTIPNLPLKLTDDDDIFIILNSNQFEGGIPAFFSQASTLDLSQNKFSDLNAFLCVKLKSATTNKRTLDFSNNQIMGQLPDCWEHLNSLRFLDLSNNNLSGKIPQSMGTLVNLEALVLRNNNLIGELPSTLRNCTNLIILDVSENFLSGLIPSWIGENLQQLKILSLRVNHFYGSLPSYLCYLRQIHLLDLSSNNLSKGIPECLKNFTALMERSTISSEIVRKRKISSKEIYYDIYDSNVLLMWKGAEREYWNPEVFLKSIDLSSNNLSGEIPKEVGYLLALVSLNLSRNNLSGEIPFEIGSLTSLDFLDLSRNRFSGKIPSSISQVDRLAKLDLSHNFLSGRIPLGRQLQTFDASSFEGNLDLCGEPLKKICPGDEAPVNPLGPVSDYDDNSLFCEALYMSLGIGYFTGFWGLLGPILLWRPWRNAYLRFLNKVTDYIYVMVVVNVAKWQRWLKR